MSGRGRGRSGGRGRSNGSNGRGQSRPPRSGKTEVKKSLADYNYYVGSAKQASDYEITTEFLINHIKKTFEFGSDIAAELKELKPLDTSKWKPSMQVSLSSDDETKEQETRQYEIEFKAD